MHFGYEGMGFTVGAYTDASLGANSTTMVVIEPDAGMPYSPQTVALTFHGDLGTEALIEALGWLATELYRQKAGRVQ